MIVIVGYLILWLVAEVAGIAALLFVHDVALEPYKVGMVCAMTGGIGGALYCLRAIYLNKCVHDRWDEKWRVWYFLRPLASVICGGVSYLFLKTGLIILESSTQPDASDLGFYAFAFIAGLNVDKFIKKLEEISETVWGIEKSRAAGEADKKQGTKTGV